ncbi:MAG: hypothetical protein AAFQ60_01050 [Pseudomonadota bacterium]
MSATFDLVLDPLPEINSAASVISSAEVRSRIVVAEIRDSAPGAVLQA